MTRRRSARAVRRSSPWAISTRRVIQRRLAEGPTAVICPFFVPSVCCYEVRRRAARVLTRRCAADRIHSCRQLVKPFLNIVAAQISDTELSPAAAAGSQDFVRPPHALQGVLCAVSWPQQAALGDRNAISRHVGAIGCCGALARCHSDRRRRRLRRSSSKPSSRHACGRGIQCSRGGVPASHRAIQQCRQRHTLQLEVTNLQPCARLLKPRASACLRVAGLCSEACYHHYRAERASVLPPRCALTSALFCEFRPRHAIDPGSRRTPTSAGAPPGARPASSQSRGASSTRRPSCRRASRTPAAPAARWPASPPGRRLGRPASLQPESSTAQAARDGPQTALKPATARPATAEPKPGGPGRRAGGSRPSGAAAAQVICGRSVWLTGWVARGEALSQSTPAPGTGPDHQ